MPTENQLAGQKSYPRQLCQDKSPGVASEVFL